MSAQLDEGVQETPTGPVPRSRPRWRARLVPATTIGAVLLVWLALVAPDRRADLSAGALLRIPVEGLVAVAVLLALPARVTRAARVLAAVLGGLLGLVTALKFLDAGFYETLDRPFHPVTDWPLFTSALDYVATTYDRPVAVVAAAVVVAALAGVMVLLAACAVRVGATARSHRRAALRPVAVLGVAWVVCAAVGLQLTAGQPVAARSSAALVGDTVTQARQDLRENPLYAQSLGQDTVSSTAGSQLLSGLKGKNVVLAFVESYGRTAVQDSVMAPGVDTMLDQGTRQLAAAGFSARSAFLTSATFGGNSWLGHSTLLSGTWVSNQTRYDDLLKSSRSTLISDFDRAGWATRATMPAVFKPWPEGSFYGYSRVDTGDEFGYQGPKFGWSHMPDQYTLAWVRDHDLRAPHDKPLMLSIELTSSHEPWAPIPEKIPWDAVGDGSVYGAQATAGLSRSTVWKDPHEVKVQYGLSIQYSISTLLDFLTRYAGPDTVLVFVGDHAAGTIVSGPHASRDVPVTIVAHDPAVLDRISSWGWQDGLRPHPDAPVWRMDTFRDRFLTAFSGPTP